MIEIRRISAADGPELKLIRLAALRDAPSAFGSTYAEEAERSDAEWSERALLASTGVDRITLLARIAERTVGTRGNSPAQLLYESMGFRETGEDQPLPSDPCADEIRMLLDLPSNSRP